MPNLKYHKSGFSLIEMAMVLMILGIMLSGLLVAVGQSSISIRRTDAKSQLSQIEEAMYGFAQAFGRLPCPATAASVGKESITNIITGVCTSDHGFVPAVTLNISGSVDANKLLLDAWQNPLRYSVASVNASDGNRAFTSKGGLNTYFNNGELAAGASILKVCSSSACPAPDLLAETVPAVIFSMGEDWATSTAANEVENTDSDITFVSTQYAEDSYDDIVLWLSPHILYSRLIKAGQLP